MDSGGDIGIFHQKVLKSLEILLNALAYGVFEELALLRLCFSKIWFYKPTNKTAKKPRQKIQNLNSLHRQSFCQVSFPLKIYKTIKRIVNVEANLALCSDV